jgi:hypothetical protein
MTEDAPTPPDAAQARDRCPCPDPFAWINGEGTDDQLECFYVLVVNTVGIA